MKKFLTSVVISIITLPCMASVTVLSHSQSQQQTGSQNENPGSVEYLRNEIMQLEKQLEQKQAKLDKCTKKNKNFQIAGVATIGLTGVGAIANVSMFSKIKNQKKLLATMDSTIASTEDIDGAFDILEDCDIDIYEDELQNKFTEQEWDMLNQSDFQEKFNAMIEDKISLENFNTSEKNLMVKMARTIIQECKKQKSAAKHNSICLSADACTAE